MMHTRRVLKPGSPVGAWLLACSCGKLDYKGRTKGDVNRVWTNHLYDVTPKRGDADGTTTRTREFPIP